MAAEATAAPEKTAATVKTKTIARARLTEQVPDKVHTWPYLVRLEMLVGTLTMAFMTLWAIVVDAPLEEPANPTKTPNPSKAPWYFLGLQEILVYFDPWFAGVVLPALIIVGLMVIPYIDINPKGNGYYFFWPWQYWDAHKTVAITNRNFTEMLGLGKEGVVPMLVGLGALGFWVTGIPMGYWIARRKKSAVLQQLGPVRYWITAVLFMIMMGTVVKVFLRLGLNIKYVFESPWINV